MGSMVCMDTWSRADATSVVHVVLHARRPRHLLRSGRKRGAEGSSSNESQQRTHEDTPTCSYDEVSP